MQVFVSLCVTKYSKQQKVEKGTSKNKNKRDAAAAAKRELKRETPIACLPLSSSSHLSRRSSSSASSCVYTHAHTLPRGGGSWKVERKSKKRAHTRVDVEKRNVNRKRTHKGKL